MAPNSNQLSAIDQNAVSMDAAGNITYLPRVTGDLTLHYDDRGHISAAIENGVTTQYTYNYARQRQIKSQGAYHTLYVYDLAGRMLAAVDESGRTYEEYIYGNESDYSPIQYRVYEDTEANTLESHQAYLASVASIRTPTDNPQGSCQSTQTSNWDRYHSGVLFEDIDTSAGSGISNPAFAKHVPILLWFLDDSEGGGAGGNPPPVPEVGVDSSVILDTATTTFTWSTISGATEYVLEVATSATALNLNPDITRVCAEQNTSAVVSSLPLNGTDVYLRVWVLVNSQWQYEDYQLGTSGLDDAREHVTRTYLVADHLQTPRFGYDTNGQLVWRWASDAFGNEAANADVDADGKLVAMNLRFPGQYYDSESGLHYNWNRYYDPRMGRYVTSDPIGLYGGLNTFGYVGGNPTRYIDALGLQVDLNYLTPWDGGRKGMNRVNVPDGAIGVGGHGAEPHGDGILDGKSGSWLSPSDVAGDIRGLPNYTPTTPIYFYVCNLGKRDGGDSFLDEVSDLLGGDNPVYGRPGTIVVDGRGNEKPPVSEWVRY